MGPIVKRWQEYDQIFQLPLLTLTLSLMHKITIDSASGRQTMIAIESICSTKHQQLNQMLASWCPLRLSTHHQHDPS